MWSRTMGLIQSKTIIAVSLIPICSFLLTEVAGLRECHIKSKKCQNSKAMTEIFHCHTAGKFPHPTNATVFLKCPDAGHKACLCHCKYEEMCFDVKTSTCQLVFLDDAIDCNRPLAVSFSEAVTRIHPPLIRPSFYQNSGHTENKVNSHGANSTTTRVYTKLAPNNNGEKNRGKTHLPVDTFTTLNSAGGDKKKQYVVEKAGDLHFTEIIHQHSLVHSNPNQKPHPNHMQKTTISARQISKPLKMIIQDHSFPSWSIALVVLCIIILLVLVILVMY